MLYNTVAHKSISNTKRIQALQILRNNKNDRLTAKTTTFYLHFATTRPVSAGSCFTYNNVLKTRL